MKPNSVTLLQLLQNSNERFFIPAYQRRYEWSTDQCDALFDDAADVALANKGAGGIVAQHFFGTVICVEEQAGSYGPVHVTLIDGQQRLTTTMLLLAAIRDASQPELAGIISSNWLVRYQPGLAEADRVKLSQVKADRDSFSKIMMGEPLDPDDNSVAARNYRHFSRLLRDPVRAHGLEPADLLEGLRQFSLVKIELEPTLNRWESPQAVFESMNSLGEPLTLADLVRNRLLMDVPVGQQDGLYEKLWLPMEGRLAADEDEHLSAFIRDWMQMTSGKWYPQRADDRNSKALYLAFKGIVRERPAADVLAELERASRLYVVMLGAAASGVPEADQLLADIRRSGATTANPLVLWILRRHQSGELDDAGLVAVLQALLTYLLRRRILSKSQGENKELAQLVRHMAPVVKGPDPGLAMFQLLDSLPRSTRLPSDREVRRALETMDFYRCKQRVLLLAMVEERLSKQRPDMDNKALQVEHIMPQTMNQAWEEELRKRDPEADTVDVHERLLGSIGNLTLIRHNQELGNAPFSKKCEVYAGNGGLAIACNHVTDVDVWDERAIERRAEWITGLIVDDVLGTPEFAEATGPQALSRNLDAKDRGLLAYEFMGQRHEGKTEVVWKAMFTDVIRDLRKLMPDELASALVEDTASSAISAVEKKYFTEVAPGLWAHTATDTNTKVRDLCDLFDALGLDYSELVLEMGPKKG